MPGQQAILDFNLKVRSYESDDQQVCFSTLKLLESRVEYKEDNQANNTDHFRFHKWLKKFGVTFCRHLFNNHTNFARSFFSASNKCLTILSLKLKP